MTLLSTAFKLQQPSKENPISYSIQLYTLRNALQEDLTGTIRRLAEIGFTQVEPYNFVATAKELGAALKEHGLSAPSGHAPLLGQNQEEIFTAAKELGISIVVEPCLPAKHWLNNADIEASADKFNAAATRAAEYGIRVGYHNHAWEVESKINGTTALEYFETLLEPELVLEVDTYWVAVGGVNPVDLLARLGDRVRLIHLKDGPINTDTKAQVPVGQGQVPVWDIIEAAKSLEIGVVEFDDYTGDIFEGIAASLSYLNNSNVVSAEKD